MSRSARLRAPALRLLAVLVVSAAASRAPAAAAQAPDAALKEAAAYRLTPESLARFAAATRGIRAAAEADPAAFAELAAYGGPPATSLDELTALFDASPALRATLGEAGTSTREFSTAIIAVLGSALGVMMTEILGKKELDTLPPGASPENIRFLREHGDELAAILADWDEIDRLIGAPDLRPKPQLKP
jgi:hypothetical protein